MYIYIYNMFNYIHIYNQVSSSMSANYNSAVHESIHGNIMWHPQILLLFPSHFHGSAVTPLASSSVQRRSAFHIHTLGVLSLHPATTNTWNLHQAVTCGDEVQGSDSITFGVSNFFLTTVCFLRALRNLKHLEKNCVPESWLWIT